MTIVYRHGRTVFAEWSRLFAAGRVKKGRLVGGPGFGLDLVMVLVSAFAGLAGMRAALAHIVERLPADLAGGGFPVDLRKGQFLSRLRHSPTNNVMTFFQHNNCLEGGFRK